MFLCLQVNLVLTEMEVEEHTWTDTHHPHRDESCMHYVQTDTSRGPRLTAPPPRLPFIPTVPGATLIYINR